MNSIDLQIHSTKSDGAYAPADLVKMAQGANIRTIALTDHDTIDGAWEAIVAGKEQGVQVIPGIEITCAFMEREFHMLGFGIDYHHQELLERLKEFQEARKRKTEKIIEKLREAGFRISFEDVLRYAAGTITRPAIAEAALKNPENAARLGGISTIHDFINEYLVSGKPTYVERRRPVEVKDAIGLIHSAGGVSVWSHPAIHFNSVRNKASYGVQGDYKKLEEILKIFIAYDLDGMECFHPDYSEDDAELLNVLAGKYGLLRTAGSDFHRNDETGKKEGAPELAYYQTFDFSLDDIVPNLEAAILRRQTRAQRIES
ncbi:PHP domain-containing protein [Patescibacteria group bacterium]|nr:PHP domain-containing protein [Patescibacteria group bacterium]